jgi:CelD/BcsL family acetyltransferase involved in cellulose biosynthesis
MVGGMIQATQALRDAGVAAEDDIHTAALRTRAAPAGRRSEFGISIHQDIDSIADEWCAFERIADCTVFQSFDWLSAWQRHVGILQDARPAIAVVRDAENAILCLLPLMVVPGASIRRLTFLGSDLCDYNAPLLAPDFVVRAGAKRFIPLWRDIGLELRRHPRLQYDVVSFEKMPETVGSQDNPLLQLPVGLNPNGAYWTPLAGDWESFYAAKRSSTTRRRDRTKRKRMSELGEVAFVTPQSDSELAASLETLISQKSHALRRMGADDVFARPGYRAFFREIATGPSACADGASEPARRRRRLRRGQSRAGLPRALLPRYREPR